MTSQRAVVEVQLRIESDDIIFLCQDHRVDFSQRAVLADEDLVEILHESSCLVDSDLFEMETVSHALCLEISKADDRIDVFLQDFFRMLSSYRFNIHAAGFRTHHDDAFCLTVDEEGQVVFLLDMAARFDQKTGDLLAFRAGLFCYECLAQDFSCILTDFIKRMSDLDAACFAASACMDLCLDDDDRRVQTLRTLHSIFDGEGRVAFRYMQTVLP